MTNKDQNKDMFDAIDRALEQRFNITISADGSWFHDGGKIHRKALVKLFATVLKRDSKGAFWLETPVEKGMIEVVDAPFIVTTLTVNHVQRKALGKKTSQVLTFTTNVDDNVQLNDAHPLQILPRPDGSGFCPYIEVRDGLLAKLSRPVYYELASYASPGEDGRMGVWSNNQFFILE